MIVFRCDANPRLGMGHLVRCRALAVALRDLGQSSVIVGPSEDYRTAGDDRLFSGWVPAPFASTPRADAEAFTGVLSRHQAAFAVLDDYRIDEDYQLTLRQAGVRWLQFNGRPWLPLWADLVLNQSPATQAEDYRDSLRCAGARLLLGPRYAVLRPEFATAARTRSHGSTGRILLTFGGGDDRGMALSVLEALLPALPAEIRFLVVSGKHNPRNRAVGDWIVSRGGGRVELQVAPASMAQAISTCDLAIMAGGGTVYEANCLGVPMLLIAIADNQIAHAQAWAGMGAARYLGTAEELDTGELVAETKSALAKGVHSGVRADRLVDGLGGVRVAREILNAMEP